MLFELLRQHDGKNNGHLHLAESWLKRRGWKSSDVVQRAKRELLDRELIVMTRQGGLNIGATLYALTWLDISDLTGLDISAYHPGAYAALNFNKETGEPHRQTVQSHTARRSGIAPPNGVAHALTTPEDGAKTAIFKQSATPRDGDNEYIPLPSPTSGRSLFGKKG
jgi:hypothetical protein